MAVPGKMEMNLFQLSCFRRRISNKNCWLILHESPEVLVTLRFSVMKNFWFSIPWAPTVLEHSGGWSTSALYPCATKGRECIALASKLPSPLEINGLRSRLKPISEGHPLSTWTKRKYSSFWRPWNGVNKQEGSRREHVFTTRKFLKWSLMCVMQLRTFFTSHATSDATLPTAELRKLYRDTVLWGGHVTPYTGITCYILHLCDQSFLCSLLQICFRCKTSTLFTSPVNFSWIPLFQWSYSESANVGSWYLVRTSSIKCRVEAYLD